MSCQVVTCVLCELGVGALFITNRSIRERLSKDVRSDFISPAEGLSSL